MKLKVKEIFHSIQGESSRVGWPTIFVRLSGCPLRCTYCDTAYAFSGGDYYEIDQVIQKIKHYSSKFVTITGGEPLAQSACVPLLNKLCSFDFFVSLETSGAFSIKDIHSKVMVVMDVKTPSSGESDHFKIENIKYLKSTDQVKFVLSDQADYQWASEFSIQNQLADRCTVLFSPVHEKLNATTLAEWLLFDQHPFRLQVQLHKYLWGNEPGR